MAAFAEVVLPLQLRTPLTYIIPKEWEEWVSVGHRVEVQLGNRKRYAGIVIRILEGYDGLRKPKSIMNVLDKEPIVTEAQIRIWQWIADYYMCTLGEVLTASLPSGLKLSSESYLILNGEQEVNQWTFNDAERILIQALYRRKEMVIGDVEDLIVTGSPYRIIKGLLEKEVLLIKERLKEKTKPKIVEWIGLAHDYTSEEGFLTALELCARAPKQTKFLLALYELTRFEDKAEKKKVLRKSQVDGSVLKSLQKKGIIVVIERLLHEVIADQGKGNNALNEEQTTAVKTIQSSWQQGKTVTLLQGVTGSGKTHVYIELIKSVVDQGGQVLFLLPEIALTTQIIQRLKAVFGDGILAYHSRLNDRERTAIWHNVKNGHPIVLGARSALLLPYKNLSLIIVDEEHDPSYKQQDPAPRYHARDLAVYMAHREDLRVVLGSATPSIETLFNTQLGKFSFAPLTSRFYEVALPELHFVDLKKAHSHKHVIEFFSKEALDAIQVTVESGEQVLIFQNRRGHSHVMRCTACGWVASCIQCDVSLTYHKVFKDLRCHYCGFKEPLPPTCPECGNPHLDYKGLGTEKIEADLKVHFPDYRFSRMDLDTARSNRARSSIVQRMEDTEVDILIGTQMITKGFDFEHIGLVVVPQADQLLFIPDFRTNERAFQMLQQVAGRAGRKNQQGKVILQTFQTYHRVLDALKNNTQQKFVQEEMHERRTHHYPPYTRLIKVEMKHKKLPTVIRAADELAIRLRHQWAGRILGPSEPEVARIRLQYIRHIVIKYEKKAQVMKAIKKSLQEAIEETKQLPGLSNVRFNINVDPN